jgi:hypothetical protein
VPLHGPWIDASEPERQSLEKGRRLCWKTLLQGVM